MFNRGLVLRVLAQVCARSLTRFSSNSGLSLAALLGIVLLIPSSGWANTTKNCPTEPAQGVPIVSGETYVGSNCVLNNAGDLDSFTFTASAGDTWSMVLGDGSSTTPSICMALLPPGSTTSIPLGCTFGTVIETVASVQKLTAGIYTIQVTEQNTGTITYGLSLERLSPAPLDGIPLMLNINVAAQVTPPTAQNAYTFLGNTADTYKITLSDAGLTTCFAVYQPDGTLVVNGGCTAGTVIPVISANVTPAQNGIHVVVVNTDGSDTTNSYDLELACVAGPDNCKQPMPPPCTMKDAPGYAAGTLTMNFTVGNNVATTWSVWLSSQNTITTLFSAAQPITVPPVPITKTASVSPAGTVGVLSTLTTPTRGIFCSSYVQVNSGKP